MDEGGIRTNSRQLDWASWGKHPMAALVPLCQPMSMNILLVLLVLLLLFGGGGFYFGGPAVGGSGLGLILLICVIVYLMGGFRTKR